DAFAALRERPLPRLARASYWVRSIRLQVASHASLNAWSQEVHASAEASPSSWAIATHFFTRRASVRDSGAKRAIHSSQLLTLVRRQAPIGLQPARSAASSPRRAEEEADAADHHGSRGGPSRISH